jgi:hypothetical protein
MDKKYLTSLEASPYVDEGLFDRVKARGAAGMQRYKGVTNVGWKPIEDTKMESLWNSFRKKVASIVQDFNVNVLPNIQRNRPQDLVAFKKDVDKFVKLGKTIYAGPRQFTNPELQRTLGTRSASDPSVSVAQKLREAGIGKFFRSPSLNQALASNDTNKTITAYKSHLKKLYDEFINDVQFVTKIPSNYVGQSIVSNKMEWAPAFNQIENLIGVPQSTKSAQASDKPTSPPTSVPPTPEPPKPPTGTAPEPAPGSPSSTTGTPPPPTELPPEKANNGQLPEGLDSDAIVKAMILITKTVRSDWERAKKYMGNPSKNVPPPELPSSWGGKIEFPEPSGEPVTEAGEGEGDTGFISKDDDSDSDMSPSDDSESGADLQGFIRKWHSAYRKSRRFSWDFGTFHHKDKAYTVNWATKGLLKHGTENDILLLIHSKGALDSATGEQPISMRKVIIFNFFDSDFDTRSGRKLSVLQMFENANPEASGVFTPADKQKFAMVEDDFQRAIIALVDRKAMEYVNQHIKDAVSQLQLVGWPVDIAKKYVSAAWKYFKDEGKTKGLQTTEVVQKAMELKKADMAKVLSSQAAGDATLALIKLGHKENTAKNLIQTAVEKLGPNASADQLFQYAVSGGKSDPQATVTTTATSPIEPATPTSAPSITDEEQLANVNQGLESIGVEKLDDVQQMKKLFANKGAWNTKVKGEAQAMVDETKPETLVQAKNHLKAVLGKKFEKRHMKLWDIIVKDVKYGSKKKKRTKKPKWTVPPVTEGSMKKGFINPFVSSNLFR